MAPEQLQGKGVDRRTDIFAAGIVLWEALTGRRLFDAEDAAEMLRMIVSEEIPPPSAVVPSISRCVDDIVMRALSRDVSTRYQTAREFAIALEEAVPLASPREVGEWVELVAGDTLLHREQAVAEIEAVSSVSDVSFEPRSLPSAKRLSSRTPPPRTIPDASKPWDDEDPTRISTSSIGSSTKRDKPTRIQVPRPKSSYPKPILGPEHIGFGTLLDEEPRTNVIEPLVEDDPTSIYPPAADHDLPSFPFEEVVAVPESRAIVVRDRVTSPPTIIVHAPYPIYSEPPSMFAVVLGWLWNNPRQRTWRVAAAAGTFALLLGFGVAAGRGVRPKPQAHPVAPAAPSVASMAPPPLVRGIDPSTLPLADDASAQTRPVSAARPSSPSQPVPAVSHMEALPNALPHPLQPKAHAVAASEKATPSPAAEHVIDLDATENPYTKGAPKPAVAVQAAAPADPRVPAACRQPYTIDAQGIRRIKTECL